MEFAKVGPTPMADNIDNLLREAVSSRVGQDNGQRIPYTKLVSSLLFMKSYTRPDITFSVNLQCRFADVPLDMHWSTAKPVFKYLRGAFGNGIMIGEGRGRENIRALCWASFWAVGLY